MDAKRLAVELQLSAKRGTVSGEQVNAVVETLLEMADKLERLEAENAKLRELLAELYQCSRQVGCDHCGDGYRRTCSVLNHLQELGMEVVV